MSTIGKSPKVNRVRFQPLAADPVNPATGDEYYSDGTARPAGLWKYNGTSWDQVGSSSQAASIVSGDNSNFEGSIGSWVAYADAAGVTPVDGTGGSPNITVTRTTTVADVLNGSGSMKIAKDAANRQGQGASLTVSVPNYIRGLPSKLSFSAKGSANFDFGTAFSSADPSDVVFYLYDVTNSKMLQPYPYTIFSNGIVECFAQIPSDCASIRVIMHIATTNALAWDLFVDDVNLSASIDDLMDSNSDWQDYTATFTAFGTVSVQKTSYRKVGDSIELMCRFTAGTPTAAEARVSLPTGLVSDATKIQSTLSIVGVAETTGNGTIQIEEVLIEPSKTYVTFGLRSSAFNGLLKQNGNDLVATAGEVSFIARLPIQGWTSGNLTAASANLNAPAVVRTFKNAGSITAATTIPTWTTVDKDSAGAFNSSTGEYTVKTPGDYSYSAQLEVSLTSTGTLQIRKNGTVVAENSAGVTSTRKDVSGTLVDLKVGDIITLTSSASETVASTNTGTIWNMQKVELSGRVYSTRVAYATDERAAGTDYGTIASGSFLTRTVNTLRGDNSFASLSSNVLTLQPGTYDIDIDVPVGQTPGVTTNQALITTRFRNTSDSTTAIVGSPVSLRTPAATITSASSKIRGRVSITSAKNFEVQQMSNTASSQGGFAGNNGEVEVYVNARITKVL